MIAERDVSPAPRPAHDLGRTYDLDLALLNLALSDERGVPLAGRAAEIAGLRRAGARNPSAGRIFEGHLNGAQLVARCGTAEQRTAAAADIAAGHLFGVWNTQDEADGLFIERIAGQVRLRGAKTWASGAGSIARPIVTAAWPDGRVQMCLVRMDQVRTRIDGSAWRPLGMQQSNSYRVDFTGVALEAADLIGAAGDYERQPWFHAGALRFAAVQTGIVERILAETVQYLRERGRDADPFQCTRVAEMKIAMRGAIGWLDAGAAAWRAFDADPSESQRAEVLDVVDMARTVVERAALDVIERAVRCVGARGLVEPEPFAALVRDLQMYLRQPAPDAALLRVGRAAFAAAAAAGGPVASSTPVG
jgi:alkylation response protein AidB-like acyl-CoA dehydrogenase